MSGVPSDPYAVLGVSPGSSDDELRRAYRELVKRHHPDHNGGAAESAARFERIQEAYAAVLVLRRHGDRGPSPGASAGSDVEERIARIERELAERRAAATRQSPPTHPSRRSAPAPPNRTQRPDPTPSQASRPSPEELGIYSTDDSFTEIFDDATEQLGERLRKSEARKQLTRRLSDLFGRDD